MICALVNARRAALGACGFVLLLACPLLASALPQHSPYPGGIAVIDVGDASSTSDIRFNGKRVLTALDNGRRYAVVGVPLDQAIGTASLAVAGGDELSFDIHEHGYREQHLTVAPGYVNPDPEASKRIAREQPLIASAIAGFSDAAPQGLQLAAPIPGARSSSFGSRRFFNKEPRSPHRGMDISGGTGTPIQAPLSGTVVLAGDFYFTGNAVFVDHGQGLISLYAHLDRIAVAKGDRVTQGQLLGTVGATGRVTGAHLHFAIYLNGTAVDPGLLLAAPD